MPDKECIDHYTLYLNEAVHGSRLGGSNQALQFSSTVVLGLSSQFFNIHITRQEVKVTHLSCVNVQDLNTALFVWQTWVIRRRHIGKNEQWWESVEFVLLLLLLNKGQVFEVLPISIFTSNRPGLIKASSIRSGLLVMPFRQRQMHRLEKINK